MPFIGSDVVRCLWMLAKFPGSPGGQGPQAEGYYRVRLPLNCGKP